MLNARFAKVSFYRRDSEFTLPTAKARAALPDALSYDKITYSLARAINIPDAMGGESTNYSLLDDRLHQPYRLALISNRKFRVFRKHKSVLGKRRRSALVLFQAKY